MKNISITLGLLFLIVFNSNASENKLNSYRNNFIFTEQGIEFAIFPDGQFDFYSQRFNTNARNNCNYTTISYNNGYNYNQYIQYDTYGAIIQIAHVPIFYDYYGRVSKIGYTPINYNNYGYINRLGGLCINYNRYNNSFTYTGFINRHNRLYINRPWHRYYRSPANNFRITRNNPYRRNYTPYRSRYTKPFNNRFTKRPFSTIRNNRTVNRYSGPRNNRKSNNYRSNRTSERNNNSRNVNRRTTSRTRRI